MINFDMPMGDSFSPTHELYLHRVGRTGRFTRKGAAFNLISTSEDEEILKHICEYYNKEVPLIEYSEEAVIEVLVKADLASKDAFSDL